LYTTNSIVFYKDLLVLQNGYFHYGSLFTLFESKELLTTNKSNLDKYSKCSISKLTSKHNYDNICLKANYTTDYYAL